ncbi:MAG TPA: aminodeoxychorismate/anthranilate synthase component II [Parvularculaceae bacterium]|nr:aminodeoxychorismate/anthranilate synthase component II [Parvularculaceae bacterium]
MILVIDNYDSFTWNLVHLIGGLGQPVKVVRNDALSAREAIASDALAIVLSPGPGTPASAGVCVETVRLAVESETPVFGVCLGLQSIAEALGGTVVRAGRQMHGKTSLIAHKGAGLFAGLPSPFTATRYHSLVARRSDLPNSLKVTAAAEDDGEIMAIEHADAPIAGVQFHPESIASEHGLALFKNFLALAAAKKSQ